MDQNDEKFEPQHKRWLNFGGDYEKGVRGVANYFTPKPEDTAVSDAVCAKISAEIFLSKHQWFVDNLPPYKGELIDQVFELINEARNEVTGKWIPAINNGCTQQGDLHRLALMADSYQYTWDILTGDADLELKLREAIVDRKWLNTPMAEMLAAAVFTTAEVMVSCYQRMAFDLMHNRDHLVWNFHKEAGTVKPDGENK